MATAERGRHSYISSDDLVSLNLSPSPPAQQETATARMAPHSSSSSSLPPSYATEEDRDADRASLQSSSTGSTSTRPKRVLFCPLALLIETACEGEKDPFMERGALLAQKGRPRLAVKTYSVGTPSTSQLTSATTRAWKSVCAGFSTSLQPLLTSPISPNSPSAREEEREQESTSFARSRSWSDPKRREEEKALEESFTPDDGKLKIKLPALRRRCCPTLSALGSGPCKGILKPRASQPRTAAVDLASSPKRTADSFPALSPITSLPISLSRSIPLPSPSSAPSTTPQAQAIPLRPCCDSCSEGAEYGLSPDSDYSEHFSKSAKRKRRRDEEAKLEDERLGAELFGGASRGAGVGAAAVRSFSPYCRGAVARAEAERVEKKEAEEEEEEEVPEVMEGGLARAVKSVDEVQCVQLHRAASREEDQREEETSEDDSTTEAPSPIGEAASPLSRKTESGVGGLLTPPLLPDPTPAPDLDTSASAVVKAPASSLPSPPTSPPLVSDSSSPVVPSSSLTSFTATTYTITPAVASSPPSAPVLAKDGREGKRRLSLSQRISSFAAASGRGIVSAGQVAAAGVGGARVA